MAFRARLTLTSRWFAPFAFALALSPVATPVLADEGVKLASDDADEDEAPKDVASVKIELKQPSGKVLKYDGAQLEFGADGNVTFKADDHVHDVSLRIERASDQSKAISLTVGYTKDGQSVIAPQTVDSEIKKREVIRIEGGVAIAITVSAKSTKKAAPEEKPPEETPEPPKEKPKKKDKIDGVEGNDPLDGVK